MYVIKIVLCFYFNLLKNNFNIKKYFYIIIENKSHIYNDTQNNFNIYNV